MIKTSPASDNLNFVILYVSKGKNIMIEEKKIGITIGVFDLFNVGYLTFLERCKSNCDYLIVGICDDDYVANVKKATPIYTAEERRRIVGAMMCVDEVMSVSKEETLDKRLLLKRCSFNVLFSGDDWLGTPRYLNTEKQFRDRGIDIVYFPHFAGFDVSEDEARARQTETGF